MGRIHHFLGLTVGVILPSMSPDERREAYGCDITYGTNNELGFDYLRDNMAGAIEECVQRGHNFAIVDEVDSILIDEARTPLIISGPTQDEVRWYAEFAKIAHTMANDTDYEVDEKKRTISVLEPGITKVEDHLGIDNLYDSVNTPLISFMNNSIKAKELFRNDKEYVVMDGEVLIVDEHTGRMLAGRRYNDGLHQAIEAKEGVEVREEYQTLATITLQNYFRLYDKLSGMTGTAMTEASEFDKIYKPRRRADPDQHADGPRRPGRPRLPHRGGQVRRRRRRHRRAQRPGPAGPGRHRLGREVRAPVEPAQEARRPAHGPQRQAARRRGQGRRARRPQGRGHRGHQHGRSRHRHHARRLGRLPRRRRSCASRASTRSRTPRSTTPPGPPWSRRSRRRSPPSTTRSASSAASTWSAPSGTSRAASTTSCVVGPAVRATRASPASTCRSGRADAAVQVRVGRPRPPVLKVPDDVPIENKRVTGAIANAQGQVESQNFESRKNVLKYDDVMNRQREVIYAERRGCSRVPTSRRRSAPSSTTSSTATSPGRPPEFAEDWDLDAPLGRAQASSTRSR